MQIEEKQLELPLGEAELTGDGPEMVSITRALYDELLEDQDELNRLHANGVDNWEGYSQGWIE